DAPVRRRAPRLARSGSVYDLEHDPPTFLRAARADERAQRPGDPALPADHLADVVRRDVEPQDERVVFLELLDTHRVGLVDEPPGQVVEQLPHAQGRFLTFSRRETESEG